MSSWRLVAALAIVLGCGAQAQSPSTRLVITFEAAPSAPTPQFLRVSWAGGGKVFADERRVPERGTLMPQGGRLGTFEIDLSEAAAWRTIVARGVVDERVVSEGAIHVFVTPGAATAATLRLGPGRLPDEDGDGIPDLVDDCPALANPGQGACPSDDGRRDAGAPPAPDAAPEAASDGQDTGGADAKLPRGRACGHDDACESGRCVESRAGRFCASPDMVPVPGGPFTRGCSMGKDSSCANNERPSRMIMVKSFELDRTEVTQALYDRCVQARACMAPAAGWDPRNRPNHPTVGVSWAMADAFCRWAGKRLPTEAEWEKAARGPDDGPVYPWGDDPPTCARAQYKDCGLGDVVPVGALAGTSAYGAEDMAGNASEWVSDLFDETYYSRAPGSDPPGPPTGAGHVRRGGSYATDAASLRVSARAGGDAKDPGTQGFRCARDL